MSAGAELITVTHRLIEFLVGIHRIPQHVIVGVQCDWCINRFSEFDGRVDVVVVTVTQDDRRNGAAADRVDDRRVVVRCVDHHHLAIVTDQPDVVRDVPRSAVE